eukprot:scaffold19113_cov14-Tisochrysis_lutea.AAC.1
MKTGHGLHPNITGKAHKSTHEKRPWPSPKYHSKSTNESKLTRKGHGYPAESHKSGTWVQHPSR